MQIITNYQDQAKWDKFVAENSSPASFLQSWDWGEFNQQLLGNQIQRWALLEDGELKIVFMLIKKNLPVGRFYYYCPRGLIFEKNYSDRRVMAYKRLLEKISAEIKSAVFIRLSPPYEFKEYMFGFIQRLGLIKPKILTHSKEPGKTLVLGLNQEPESLLKQMRPKTRYNIRLAIKKGVHVRTMNPATQQKDIDIFYRLTQVTGRRDKIHVYDKKYYQQLINYFSREDKNVKLKLYLAEFNQQPLAAIMVVYFGRTATYLHGASDNAYRNLMPNYLLQWQAIQDAWQAGYKIYDFWGISERRKSWAGITRFKKGFGGRTINFIGSWDYVLNKRWYNLFRLMRLFKKIIP